MSQDTLVRIYVECSIAEQNYLNNPDSIGIHKNKVFKKYNLSREEFFAALEDYKTDPLKWDSFFKNANSYLTDLKNTKAIN